AADGGPKPYLSFKLDPARVPGLPEPKPMFEIWVYAPRVEGVHLRGGRVARGGLRWSDRREDFRTEVLGLVKAQMVKNTVIVPVGSKGGFVLKRLPAGLDRETLMKEGVACYQAYLRGLRDLTDHRVGDRIGPPGPRPRRGAAEPAPAASPPAPRPLRSPAHLRRSGSGCRSTVRRARAPLPADAFIVGRLRRRADFDGRRHLSAQREVDRRHAGSREGAGDRGEAHY